MDDRLDTEPGLLLFRVLGLAPPKGGAFLWKSLKRGFFSGKNGNRFNLLFKKVGFGKNLKSNYGWN